MQAGLICNISDLYVGGDQFKSNVGTVCPDQGWL
jgi:hypothetical protein